jgi:hypothetical protein
MVQTPRGETLLRNVNELIDPITQYWDENLIWDIFNMIGVSRILSIPLNGNMDEDFIAWHFTKSYSFSVRSAYYVEWNHNNGNILNRRDGQGTVN